ncbi:MAG: putative surface protein with fasciclin (FAS1) repeats [Acidimicrobiales bacterium]|jgi:uncharacterized surface protein with fasciclin (FAS1) repeats
MTSPQEPSKPQRPNQRPADRTAPKPWYETPGGLVGIATLILAVLAAGVVAFVLTSSGDDVDASATSTTVEETTTTAEESTSTTSDEDETTTSSQDTASTSTTAAIETTTTTAGQRSTTALSVPPTDDATAWKIIKNSPDLSMFRRAIEDADLIKLFEDGKPITVFAPSNDAFAALTAGVGGQAILDDPDLLAALVLHHVSEGAMSSSQVLSLAEIETNNDDNLTIDGPAMTVGGAAIVVADVAAGSSVIHVIDQVLIP